MSGIYNNLAKITDIKNDIKQSIANKGIDMTDVPFADYPEKIDEIVVNGDYQIGYDAGRAYQKSLLIPFTITQNGTYERQNGYSKVIVNIEDNDGDYQQGYTDGYSKGSLDGYENGFGIGEEYGYNNGVAVGKEQQKSLLEQITITQNGIYTKEDGYDEVVVNVEGGGTNKIMVKYGIKFGYSTMRNLPNNLDFEGITDLSSLFYYCRYLQSIPEIDATNITDKDKVLNAFYRCDLLSDFGGLKNIKVDFNLSDCKNLTYESCINVLNGLADLTGQSSATLFVNRNFTDLLNDEDGIIATEKNWIIMATITV